MAEKVLFTAFFFNPVNHSLSDVHPFKTWNEKNPHQFPKFYHRLDWVSQTFSSHLWRQVRLLTSRGSSRMTDSYHCHVSWSWSSIDSDRNKNRVFTASLSGCFVMEDKNRLVKNYNNVTTAYGWPDVAKLAQRRLNVILKKVNIHTKS